MKLITEHTDDIQIITEEKEGKKSYFIEAVEIRIAIKNDSCTCKLRAQPRCNE